MLLCVLAVCGEGWGALAGKSGGWGGWVDGGSVVDGGWGMNVRWRMRYGGAEFDILGIVRLPRNLING